MKRYNHDSIPMPMVEDKNGYWVTYEDHNHDILEHIKQDELKWAKHNKQLSSTTNAREEDLLLIHQMRKIIIGMSIATFAALALFFFTWL
jgi:hypothetical protein